MSILRLSHSPPSSSSPAAPLSGPSSTRPSVSPRWARAHQSATSATAGTLPTPSVRSTLPTETMRETAIGGGIGAASGVVGGAIFGSPGTGAAVGAASGATASLLGSLLRPHTNATVPELREYVPQRPWLSRRWVGIVPTHLGRHRSGPLRRVSFFMHGSSGGSHGRSRSAKSGATNRGGERAPAPLGMRGLEA